MKIKKVTWNNRKKCFSLATSKGILEFPYSLLHPKPSSQDEIKKAYSDAEIGKEAFTYLLQSGKEGTVHIDQVLEYNQDTDYLREALLYKLTLKAQSLLKEKKLSARAIMRRMHTSPTQFYRLLDQTNYNKSIDQMAKLLAALDCYVDVVFKKAA